MGNILRKLSGKRFYFFKKTFWMQSELTYAEDGKVKDILKPFAGFFKTKPKPDIIKIVDKVYDEGSMPSLLRVVLKPHSFFLFRVWNHFFVEETTANGGELCNVLKNSEIAEVLRDFFLLNTSWMPDLRGLSSMLELEQAKGMKSLLESLNLSKQLQSGIATETRSKRK